MVPRRFPRHTKRLPLGRSRQRSNFCFGSQKARVLSPSDLDQEGPIRVGARVVQASGQCAELGDALARVRVEFTQETMIRPGDWVVVAGWFSHGSLTAARVIEHAQAPEPRGRSEVARLSWDGVGQHLRARARAMTCIRQYFASQGFLEVDTPIRVKAPQLDSGLRPISAGMCWLSASPEYHMKRLLVGGMPRIYQLAHCFRDEELGPWHQAEFTMLEWYRSFANLDDVLEDTECIVARVVGEIAGRRVIESPISRARVEVEPPFERWSVQEAFSRSAGIADVVDLAATDEQLYFRLLVERVEPSLAAQRRPVFLRDYPLSQAALARPTAPSAATADRAELYLGGIELCNGYSELVDAKENAARLLAESERRALQYGEEAPMDARFLAALEEGMPRAAGNALGFDRMIALALGVRDLEEVQAFPHHWL